MSSRRQFGAIRLLASGRYQVRYRDRLTGELTPAPTTFATKKEANLYLSRVETEIERGTFIDPNNSKISLSRYAEKWLANHPALRPRTRENYDGNLRLHILPRLGAIEIGQLKPATVREWHSQLSATALAPTTVARAYRILKSICATAVADEIIHRNPCAVRGASTSKSAERPVATINQVWELANTIDPRYKALILLATFTGLRLGELLALTQKDIHLRAKAPFVSVTKQVFEMSAGAHQFGPPKTDAGTRNVTLPPPLIPILIQHLTTISEPGSEGLVFPAPKGGLIRRSNFNRRIWAPATRRANLVDFHFHDLRHTGNTLAAMTGASTKELMSRMGHASPRAALLYQHATRERDAEIANRLGALITE